jgi:hypothetical protein
MAILRCICNVILVTFQASATAPAFSQESPADAHAAIAHLMSQLHDRASVIF